MKFKVSLEKYSGVKEYTTVESFCETLKNIINNIEKNEILSFRLFDIETDKIKKSLLDQEILFRRFNKMNYDKGLDLIKHALQDRCNFIDCPEIHILTKIARRTLNRYLKIAREQKPKWMLYKKVSGKWVYKYKGDKKCQKK